MKITNNAIFKFIGSLTKFRNQTGLIGFAIAKNLRILRSEIADCEEAKNALVVKYGTKDEEGNYYITENSENYKAFVEEYVPILNAMVDVDLFQIDEDKFDFVYEENASVEDYEVLEAILVKR